MTKLVLYDEADLPSFHKIFMHTFSHNSITPPGSPTVRLQQDIYPSTFLMIEALEISFRSSCPNISAGVVESIGSSCTSNKKNGTRTKRRSNPNPLRNPLPSIRQTMAGELFANETFETLDYPLSFYQFLRLNRMIRCCEISVAFQKITEPRHEIIYCK